MKNEKRLIDANALSDSKWWESLTDDFDKARARIIVMSAPTVDAVEVVRCKDCKHWHEGTGWCNHHSHFVDSDGEACHPHESSQWKMLDADDYCSVGERRTDDG